jgi:hypothetical protein
MPQVRFESTIPVFERRKTVRGLDRSAIGTGDMEKNLQIILNLYLNYTPWHSPLAIQELRRHCMQSEVWNEELG